MRYLTFILSLWLLSSLRAQESWTLLPQVAVTSDGVYLSDLLQGGAGEQLPRLRLTNAPAFGKFGTISRADILAIAHAADAEFASLNIEGPERIRITRASRVLQESELKTLLTDTIQSTVVKERGDLELRFTRAWIPLRVPDELLTLKILELPTSGIASQLICKIELLCGDQSCGIFSLPLQAFLWREVYVAAGTVLRGQLLREAQLTRERRDLLVTRDPLWELPLDNPYIELAENIRAGYPITSRSLRLRSVVKRGRHLDALLETDGLKVTAKVEALEDGIPGQVVRVRNIRSKRELKGRVQDEQTIQVLF